MTSQAETVDLLVKKGKFEPQVALAITEVIDNAMCDAQVVTVPILDARLAELRADARITAHELKSEIVRLEQKIENTRMGLEEKIDGVRTGLEKTIEASNDRTKAELVRWVFATMLGNVALAVVSAVVTSLIQHPH